MTSPLYTALSHYIDLLLDAVCAVDQHGCFEFLSQGAERIFGYKPEEMLGKSMFNFIHPDDRQKTLDAAQAINQGQVVIDFENRYIRKDGQVVYLLWSARWSGDKQQRVAVARDITQLKQTEARQAAMYAISEAAFTADDLSALYQQLQHIIASLMPLRSIVIARGANAAELYLPYINLEQTNAAQQADAEQFCCGVLQQNTAPHQQLVPDQQGWLGVRLKASAKTLGVLAVQLPTAPGATGFADSELIDFIGQHIAIAIERKELLSRLHYSALYDELTQLPKRELFKDRCQQALAALPRHNGCLALFYLDLDNFKPINDQLGHAAGDSVLQEVAKRIQRCIRHSDTVARFGGDEFVILLSKLDEYNVVFAIAEQIRLALAKPILFKQHAIHVTSSIGVALYPSCGANTEQLMATADQAMYQAKRQGGNRWLEAKPN
ncbi:MAG: diguanylate cyclase [Alishewanella sp.]|nr:diguanylate cyclase [Alishewanella sp.]